MYYKSVFKEKYLLQEIESNSNKKILIKSLKLLNSSSYKGHNLLFELIKSNDSTAIVLSSLFSQEYEDEKSFNDRHLKLLYKASKLENKLALYSLGVYLDTGEYITENKILAMEFFKKSAELGMPQSMTIYGIMLYYGTGGTEKDIVKGLTLIRQSASMYEDNAVDFLNYISQ
ncbi:MAG: hypothetical protein QM493_07555 [Sulfurovum sp.]